MKKLFEHLRVLFRRAQRLGTYPMLQFLEMWERMGEFFCDWPGYAEPGATAPPTLTLYRNKGDGAFEDVTAACGLAITIYGMGVTAGDYDNDGWPDLFVTGVGGNRLFRNVANAKGGRRFVDVTAEAGVGGPGGWPQSGAGDFLKLQAALNFSSSATFLDYDGDGLLDLFVCNYLDWSPKFDLDQPFTLSGSRLVGGAKLSATFATTTG